MISVYVYSSNLCSTQNVLLQYVENAHHIHHIHTKGWKIKTKTEKSSSYAYRNCVKARPLNIALEKWTHIHENIVNERV